MAEAYGKLRAPDGVRFYSAGSSPSGLVNPKAIAAMAELDYDLSAHQSKSLNDVPQIEYDHVITMGCGDECPFVQAKRRIDWGVADPKRLPAKDFVKTRDAIGQRVDALIAELVVA